MPASPAKTTARFQPWWVLLMLIAVIAAARYHTYNEPIERDLAFYAVIGHEMLQGRLLYTDLFANQPPLISLTYALSELVVGYGQQEFFFLGLLAALLTLLGIYRVGVAGAGIQGGIWAAAIWTLSCSDMLLQANQPNLETFINLGIVWALVFLIPYPVPIRNMLLAGVMLAVSSLYKIVGIQFALLFPLAFLFFEPKGRRIWNTLRSMALLAAPIFLAWVGTVLYFKLNGRWVDFYNGVYIFNTSYAGNSWRNLIQGLSPEKLLHPGLFFLIPLLLLIVLACLKSLKAPGFSPPNSSSAGRVVGQEKKWFRDEKQKKQEHQTQTLNSYDHDKNLRIWVLFGALVIGTYFSVARSGKFFPHYYQYWLPLAAIAGGWALAILGDWLKPMPWGKWLCWTPAALTLGFILVHEVPNYALTAEQWSQKKYGNDFLESREMARKVSEILKPGEDFFHFSKDPNLYFYSQKKPPTGILWIDHALCGSLTNILMGRYKRDLAANPAELMVVDQRAFSDHYKNILDGFVYWASFPEKEHYTLWMRKGGKLEARLRDGGSLPPGFRENPAYMAPHIMVNDGTKNK